MISLPESLPLDAVTVALDAVLNRRPVSSREAAQAYWNLVGYAAMMFTDERVSSHAPTALKPLTDEQGLAALKAIEVGQVAAIDWKALLAWLLPLLLRLFVGSPNPAASST